jgi:exosortase
MISEWYDNPDHSHGFLIPFIAAYFVWDGRLTLTSIEIRPTNWGILILLSGIIMYFLGQLGAAHTTTRVSLLITLAGIFIFLYGKNMFRSIMFPFMFLFLMIPAPRYLYDLIAFPLKLFVTKYSVLLLDNLGIMVIREGNVIMMENITLQVVDACSGIRSLISIIVVAITLAYITQQTAFKRGIIILSAIPISVIANMGRIVVTGIMARYYGSIAAEGFFHDFAGLAVFGFEAFLIGAIALLLNKLGK